MKVLSLFDGISCGRVALERAGLPVSRYVAYEIDKNAIKCSAQNWPDIEHRGSVIGADFSEFVGFDLVMGGFPCQDLSIAGKRAGLKGMRSGLFWYLVDAIETIKPRYFFVENNVGMPKEAKRIITETLGVEPMAVDSALVSAQTRKRLYWTNIPNVAMPEDRGIHLSSVLENSPSFTRGAAIRGQVNTKGIVITGLDVRKDHKSNALNTFARTCGITDLPPGRYIEYDQYTTHFRPLSPIERERLQGLPTNYTSMLPNSYRVTFLGNGWQVDTIEHFFNHMATDMLI